MVRAIATTAAVVCGVLLAAGCAGSGPKGTAHYATSPATTNSAASLNSARVEEIRLARSSSPFFSIFPSSPGEPHCVIPAGGLTAFHLHGSCRTAVRHARTRTPEIVVSFTEAWFPKSHCPPGDHCPAIIRRYHTWSIVERALPTTPVSIVATRQSGVPAPQFND